MEVDEPCPRASPPADLYSDLRRFIEGAAGRDKTDPHELAHLALSLLKNLLAARDAVLEYFCSLFDAAVSHYVKQIEVFLLYFEIIEKPFVVKTLFKCKSNKSQRISAPRVKPFGV